MKLLLTIVGVLAIAMGLLWIGQGTGLVQWPASSFMIDERPWAWRGVVLVLVGIVVAAYGRKR